MNASTSYSLDRPPFNLDAFLHSAGVGRRQVELREKQIFFTQGESSDCIFYLHRGRVRLTVTSARGKEATIGMINNSQFIGEDSIAMGDSLRPATATAITPCSALRIERAEMTRAVREEHALSDTLVSFLLTRAMRMQEDLIDQLFNSSEKRLARVLLLLAQFGNSTEAEKIIPKISQETLAEMIGTTRSRASFFMNRFRELGYIEYDGKSGIKVHKTLLTVFLGN